MNGLPIRRSGPPARKNRSRRTPTDLNPTVAADPLDGFDERVIAQVDWSIWRAIKAGEFRLGAPCRCCGRY